jgi:glycosyltransferase involved in cell wall biosynthesis
MSGVGGFRLSPVRVLRGLARRFRAALRGGSPAGYFDPFHRGTLARLLAEFDLPLPTPDPDQAADGEAGAARFVLGLWLHRAALRRRFPTALSGPSDGPFPRWLTGNGLVPDGLPEPAARNLEGVFAVRPFDRVRQVFELRADVRDVFPLGLTPAGRGAYATWLFRHARHEYKLRDDEILWYLFALDEDPSAGLADTFLLSPAWQAAVPHGLTLFGWDELKRWLLGAYPHQLGRWFGRARLPDRFSPGDQLRLLRQARPAALPDDVTAAALAGDPRPVLDWLSRQRDWPRPPAAWLRRLDADIRAGLPGRPAVNLLGHFKYESGLQEVILQYAAALRLSGYSTLTRDIPISYPRDWRDARRFTELELGDVSLIMIGASDPLDEVYPRSGLFRRPGVYRVACWAWELEQFPPEVAAHAGLADEVWVPSEFCARAVRAALPDRPVLAMPPAVAAPPFEHRPRSYFGLPDDRFLFLFVFDMASGMERKNPLGLVRAFRAAFRPSDPVHLAIKVSRGEKHPAEFANFRRAAAEAGVTLLDRLLPRGEVLALLATCDAYVSLHRSEGFGFTMAEAMLLGKPTVATAYSGNLDFMTADNSFLVDYDRVALDRDLPPYPRGGVWAEPSVAHAAELMRRVVDRPAEARAVAARGRETVAKQLSPEATARRLAARVEEIRRRHPGGKRT